MSDWTTQVEQHPLNDVLRSAGSAAETLLAQEVDRDPETTERLSRVRQVLSDTSARLAAIDPDLLPLQALNNLNTPVQRINDNLNAYQSSADPNQVVAAHNQLENVLVHLNLIPIPRTPGDIEGIREATTGLRRSIGQNVRQLESQSAGALQTLAALTEQMKSVEARLAESQARLDTRIEEAEQRLAAAESQRSSLFEGVQSERQRQADELHQEKAAEWEAALQGQRTEFAQAMAQASADAIALKEATAANAKSMLQEMEVLKVEAQNLVGIITDTGMIGGYQKEADSAQRAGTAWRVVAAVSLAGLVVFAVYVFVTHVDRAAETTWADVGWRVFVASAVGLFAAYAARQADKHDRTRRRSRRMQLELASISPYLYALPEEQQIEMKMDLARRLFGQAESGDSKDDAPTSGTQTDVIRLLAESVQSLISK